MRPNVLILTLLGLGLGAARLAAQETGTPVFLAPYRAFQTSELAGYFSDPGAGWALEGTYRTGSGTADLGFRLGLADSDPGPTRFLVGMDFRDRLITHTESFPLDGALTLGLGGQISDQFSRGFIPIGISLGRRVELEGSQTSFVPYLHPILTPTFGDGPDDVLFSIGLGVDIRFNPRFDVRVAGALGDYDGISIGVGFLR